MQLDSDSCSRARLARDWRFDGLFFFGVKSTGIFCRPVCPAKTPKEENVVYFPSAAAAAEAGFRPCLRCRPESAPAIRKGAQARDLYLSYRPDFDWRYMLEFMQPRIIPGVEEIDNTGYRRTFRIKSGSEGWFEVLDCPERHALRLSVHTEALDDLMRIQQRVRVMFDLEANLEPVRKHLEQDELLREIVGEYPSVRLPGAWDPFEFATRAILGQQISVKAATTLAGRIASSCGKECGDSFPEGLSHFFPTAEEMALADISGLGITGKRQETIRNLVDAVLGGAISLDRGQALESFVERFTSMKGIGPWTAHYLGMRALGLTDAFPASDLGVRKALAIDSKLPSEREVNRRAEQWRPWRAYAALYLWKLAAKKENKKEGNK